MDKVLRFIIKMVGGDTATKQFDELGGGVKGLVKSLAGMAILQQVGSWLVDFGKQAFNAAARAERLGRATDNLSRSLNTTGTALTEGIQDAVGGAVDEISAMEAANKAMMLGVVSNQAEMEELARIAVVVGNAMGLDAATSLDDFTTALGRQSPMILDNLGLTVDVDKANRAYAESLGKTADQLTDAERKQAFLNSALDAGRTKMEELGGVTEDALAKTEKLGAAYADLQAALGSALTTALEDSGVADYLTRSMNVWEAIAEAAKFNIDNSEAITAITETENRLATIDQQVINSQKIVDDWGKAWSVGGTDDQLNALIAKIAELKAERETLTATLEIENTSLDRNAGMWQEDALMIQRANNQLEAQQEAADAVTRKTQRALEIAQQREAVERNIARAMQDEDATAYQVSQTFKDGISDIRDAQTAAADEAGRAYSSAAESAASKIRSAVTGIIQPSLSEVWQGEQDETHIDEWGRRAATIMTNGLGSEWIPALKAQFGGTDFWQPIQEALDSGDIGTAQNMLGNLLTQNPEALWDKELIKQRVRDQLRQSNARETLINTVMQELNAEGENVDLGTVQTAMGVSPMGGAVADQLSNGLPGAMAQNDVGGVLVKSLTDQIEGDEEGQKRLANALADGLRAFLPGALETTEDTILDVIAELVARKLGISAGMRL